MIRQGFRSVGGFWANLRRICVRAVIELRHPLGSNPIEEIKLNAKSRNDTPALLIDL